MNQQTIEQIVLATIEQLIKQPEQPVDNSKEWLRASLEKDKLRRMLKKKA